ncbi:MAG: hypothetical protein ACPGU7_05775 [Gammaproteobacteria bacterium]
MSDHDRRISELYARGPREEPPADLDSAIRAQAARALRETAGVRQAPRVQRRSRWMVPLATAATLLLSVGLVMRMGGDVPGEQAATMDTLVKPGPVRNPPQALNAPRPGVGPSAPAPRALPAAPPESMLSEGGTSALPDAGRITRHASPRVAPPVSEEAAGFADRADTRQPSRQVRPASTEPASKALNAQQKRLERGAPAVSGADASARSEVAARSAASTVRSDALTIDSSTALDQVIQSLRHAPESRWWAAMERLDALGRQDDARALRRVFENRFPGARELEE